MTSDEKAEIINTVRVLVKKFAYAYWWRLPMDAKWWISAEDLAGECYLKLLQALDKYNHKTKLSTFVSTVVLNHLNGILVERSGQKRRVVLTRLEDVDIRQEVTVEDILPPAKDYHAQFIHVADSMLRLYEVASPMLRTALRLWFSQNGLRIYAKGLPERVEEFNALAKQFGITHDDCVVLLQHGFKLRGEE